MRSGLEGVGPLGLGESQDLEGLIVEEVKLAIEAAGDGLGELEGLGDDVLTEVLKEKGEARRAVDESSKSATAR